jgi:hypothetical protein
MTARYSSVFIAALLLSTGCDVQVSDKGVSLDIVEGKASDEWTRTYTLPKEGRLEIVNPNGLIEAFPATGANVEVRVTREVRSRSDEAARELLKQVSINEEVAPDRVKIETADVRQMGGFRQGIRIEYRVNIPPGLNVSLKTQNGAVRLENVEGRLAASSTNGGVTGSGLSGAVDASTVNGGIVMDLASVTGDVRIVTVNGGIRLNIPRDTNATLDATAVNGGVSVSDELPLTTTERARLRVSGRINNGGPKIEVQTTNGGIRIGTGEGGPEEFRRRERRGP